MKTTIWIIVAVAVIVYGMGLRIDLKPFRLNVDSAVQFVGYMLIVIGVSILSTSEYRKGLQHGKKITIEALQDIENEKQQNNGK